jgi:hypothetical protein
VVPLVPEYLKDGSRQEDNKFKVSSKTARATQRNSVSKNKKTKRSFWFVLIVDQAGLELTEICLLCLLRTGIESMSHHHYQVIFFKG